ncbi:uncharacterized protein LOC103318096 [Nasonia vitripennis]|uniref:Cyclic nucleotide-binding domain-containing protein n=1 Tax=Nasonia vitripennis TaxID=7425 RepID=A0A7M7Q5B9_NASVI|nr:uncharacterized protein LOC103318096 [Nasonia vitripennis]XP_008217569.1 uncharacterized protein LOC103318096 [Nasonia vitripennis]XP_016842163.1 uncharacterized protein LOC103318096 [Nasonia vitripennis]XP_016842164.1 uncharacterized protein LOC103318096 [Nasonia vitripennis]XP_031780554.1 uncharacterized protein LOC103318096 [Nasonia vitripennis]
MERYKQNSTYYKENKRFLKRTYNSKADFLDQYDKLYSYDKTKTKLLYHQILLELKISIKDGDIEQFKRLSNFLCYINASENHNELVSYYEDAANSLKKTNFIILACQCNSTEIIKYIFDNYSTVLKKFFLSGKNISPEDKDESCHTAFYYAIRWGNIQVLEIMINGWPDNYFANSDKLEEICSKTYEELKLKNVPLTKEVKIFIEDILINLRFFSSGSNKASTYKLSISNINERIEIVLERISRLSALDKVDDKCVFITRFIAQNIFILKQQLKCTYDRLPWEEIEFCLICFISSYIKKQEINLFYQATLSSAKIVKYLSSFANKLKSVQGSIQSLNISKLSVLPKINRDLNVNRIISENPEFKELYDDFKELSEIYSLDKINNYVNLTSLADPKRREGQLVIIRCLQVIGQYLKNTLESPKLSSTISETLLLSLPINTRDIFISLQNSLSNLHTSSKILEIEQNHNIHYFVGLQNDTRKIGTVTAYMLFKNKIRIVKDLLKKIVDLNDADKLGEVALLFNKYKLDSVVNENFNSAEYDMLESLISELKRNVTDKTVNEVNVFDYFTGTISGEKSKLSHVSEDFFAGNTLLSNLFLSLQENGIESSDIILAKGYAEKILDYMNSTKKSDCMKKITELVVELYRSRVFQIKCDNFQEIDRLTCKLMNLAKLETDNIAWVDRLKKTLNKSTFIGEAEEARSVNLSDENYVSELTSKLLELQSVLYSNILNNNSNIITENISNKVQAMLELLIYDVLSILGSAKNCLENNLLFLDEITPLLIGKNLRNHLAYNNPLNDVLPSDVSVAIILNAKKMVLENLMTNKKKIGRSVREDPDKLRSRYKEDLVIISRQQQMFSALEEGSLACLKHCIASGADINGYDINFQTTLHVAAKGCNLEVVEFLLDQGLKMNGKDNNGQIPLHVAAEHGRANIVQLLLKANDSFINDKDNKQRTPLHYAALKGHHEAVSVLLKHKANNIAKDQNGFAPLHYAITNNHRETFLILIGEEEHDDYNESMGGFTLLHLAAEKGHPDIIDHLLNFKANVADRTDKGVIPLHLAVIKGNVDATKILILRGSNVNAKNIKGSTPLHLAAEYGCRKIASILLKYGADANALDNDFYTPLHYAAKSGFNDIINTLVKYGANVVAATDTGVTPIHLAMRDGHLHTVHALLQHDPSIILSGRDFLNIAIDYGHKEVVEYLVNLNVDVNVPGVDNVTPVHMAASEGYSDLLRLFLEHNGNVNVEDVNESTPLHAAVDQDVLEVVKILVENDAHVNHRALCGSTPVHVAAMKGNLEVIGFLMEHGGDVNTTDNDDATPLHLAAEHNHKDAIVLLLKKAKNINAQDYEGKTPLLTAIEVGSHEAVEVLVAKGADVDITSKTNCAPLSAAVKFNYKKIVKLLIANGANVDAVRGQPLLFAVLSGNKDMVDILIQSKAKVDFTYDGGISLLHVAVEKNFEGIANSLIASGIDVNCADSTDRKPLHIASELGHEELVRTLIANGAVLNDRNVNGMTALHLAAVDGHTKVLEILLQSGADMSAKNNAESTPLETAVAVSCSASVKVLLERTRDSINLACYKGYTLLHIAVLAGNLSVVRLLVESGANVDVKDSTGAKPIHYAATKDRKDIVEYFVGLGQSVDEAGPRRQLLLHYAALAGQLSVTEYLVQQGADVNARDEEEMTPLHLAAHHDHHEIVTFLVKNGAYFNASDETGKKPVDMGTSEALKRALAETELLFGFVSHSEADVVQERVNSGAIVNARNSENLTPLHIAVSRGNEDVVNVLLEADASPNVADSEGLTPLHYAAKFSHLKIAKSLLASGAVYNAVCKAGKTPLDVANERNTINLLKMIDESFQSIANNNFDFIKEIKKIKNIGNVRAIAGAANREHRTLVAHAMHCNFSRVDQLKRLWQDSDTTSLLGTAEFFLENGQYEEAISQFTTVLNKRREIFSANDPSILEIKYKIGCALFETSKWRDAQLLLEGVYEKQEAILGAGAKDSLATKTTIALLMQQQRRSFDALAVLEEVYERQREQPATSVSDILSTRVNMALVLEDMRRFDDAMQILADVFEIQRRSLGLQHAQTMATECKIAQLLHRQGKCEESLRIHERIYERKRQAYGPLHPETQRASNILVQALIRDRKFAQAMAMFEERHESEKAAIGATHPDCMQTRQNMALMYLQQGKYHTALRIYRECRNKTAAALGRNNPKIQNYDEAIRGIEEELRRIGCLDNNGDSFENLMRIAIRNDKEEVIRRLLAERTDVNCRDTEGKSLLHFAVDRGNPRVVRVLLDAKANVHVSTNQGNTPLHIATLKGSAEIVEMLLGHVSGNKTKLSELVNAKTKSRGTTALHVAAKNGHREIVKCLLRNAAIYDARNNDSETPLQFAGEPEIVRLLSLIGELFGDAQRGDEKMIAKIEAANADEVPAITNARNSEDKTLIQIALVNKHKQLAAQLLRMINKPNES